MKVLDLIDRLADFANEHGNLEVECCNIAGDLDFVNTVYLHCQYNPNFQNTIVVATETEG